jgi:hypothetical protein
LSIKRSIPNPISLGKDKDKEKESAQNQNPSGENDSPKQNSSISDSISATASSVSATASSVFEKFEKNLKSPFDFNNNNNNNGNSAEGHSIAELRSNKGSQKNRQSGRFFPKLDGPSISLPVTIFGYSLQDSDDNKSPEVFPSIPEQQPQQQNHSRHNSSNKYENSPTPRSSLSDMIEENSNSESENARQSLSGSGKISLQLSFI